MTDGEQAIVFVRRQGEYADADRPDLILLDLNLPRKDGREVLAELKEDRELKSIPVIVLTTSTAEGDVDRCYQTHGEFVRREAGRHRCLPRRDSRHRGFLARAGAASRRSRPGVVGLTFLIIEGGKRWKRNRACPERCCRANARGDG